MRRMASIAVVGAGLAGLSCAFRLARAGHDVELFEREAEVGGRARSRAFGDCRLDDGASFDLARAQDLVAIARAAGIANRLRPLPGPAVAVLRAGAFHALAPDSPRWWLATPLLSARARLGLLGLALRGLGARAQGAAPLLGADERDAASWLRERVGSEAAVFAAEPLLAGAGSDPSELSAALALPLVASGLRGLRLASFAHGNAQLAAALAAGLRVRTGCEVVAVETEAGGARLRCRIAGRDDQVLADAAVVAVPGDEVTGLCKKLTPDERGALEQVAYTRVVRVHLRLGALPPALAAPIGCRVLPLPEWGTSLRVHATHLRPGAAPPGSGLLCVELPEAALRHFPAPDADGFLPALLERFERTPLAALPLRAHRIESLKHAPRFAAGSRARQLRFEGRLERSPRLVFAGDWRAGPEAHAAVTSGMRAATEVVRIL